MDFSSPFDVMGLPRSDLENYEDFPGHTEFTERLRKTLYYGSDPDTDQPSLPVTDIAIDLFQDASPSPHKKIDKNFASRISRKSSMSPCAFMLSMVYIERMKRTNPEYLVKISSADLFLVSMMIASKYLYDEGEEEEMYNDEWAEAAGIDVDTVNEMEIDFLAAIDWNLYIKPVEFFQFLHKIETRIAIQEGNKRGWFSYTDLLVLLEGQNFHNIFMNAINQTVQVASICALMYGMCAAAMIGSSALALQSTMSTAPLTEIPIPVLEPTYLMPIYHSGTGVARFVSRGCFTPGSITVTPSVSLVDLVLQIVPSQESLLFVLNLQFDILSMCVRFLSCCACNVLSTLTNCAYYCIHCINQTQPYNLPNTRIHHYETCKEHGTANTHTVNQTTILQNVDNWHGTSSMNILPYPPLCVSVANDKKLPVVKASNFSRSFATSSLIF